MFRSFKIGKLFGIPLYIHTTFFLLPLWLLLTNAGFGLGNALFLLALLVGVFSCVVLHELGHALMARYFGIGTRNITLYPIGGVAQLERMSEKPTEEICIALAGPAVNLVLALLLAPLAILTALAGVHPSASFVRPGMSFLALAGQMAHALWLSNVALLLFNLLPCFPMDGGRVLRALLAIWKGHLRATEIAVRIGMVLALLIAALALMDLDHFNPMPILLAAFVYFAGRLELMGLRQREAQRRRTALLQAEAEPVLEAIPIEKPPAPPFTGIAWDNRYRVWVQWQNGHPVAFWG